MEYAVFKAAGKQYKVSVGDVIKVDRLAMDKDSTVTFEDVLLWVSDDKVQVGAPYIKNGKIVAKVLDQVKGDKIRVFKYKAKVRHRRVTGFRAMQTIIQVEQIGEEKVEKAKEITQGSKEEKVVKRVRRTKKA